MSEIQIFQGSCHCGKLGLRLETAIEAAQFTPRACDCSFCQKHGAAYISDRQGRLEFYLNDPSAWHTYRQGSEAAEFVLCRDCGVLLGVLYEEGGITYGAVNAGCLDARHLLGPSQVASPQKLSAEEKKQRWTALWTSSVARIVTSGSVERS